MERVLRWRPARLGLIAVGVAVMVYFGCPPLLWLPLAPKCRRGEPLSPVVPIVLTPIRLLFDYCQPYRDLVYYEAQFLDVDDFDYEGRILGTD